MRKTKLVYALALAPLLMGGADIAQNTSELSLTESPPKCTDDQFLVYRGGALACEAVMGGSVNVTDCKTPNQLLTFSSVGEFAKYSCTDKGSLQLNQTDIDRINMMESTLTLIGTDINAIKAGGKGSAPVYVGVTDTTVNGAMDSGNGQNPKGLASAATLCAAKFGQGAKMCTVYDIYTSIALGSNLLKPGTDVAMNAWVWQSSGNRGGTEPTANIGENCAHYTYGTGDQGWQGTVFNWTKVTFTQSYAPKFRNSEACNQKHVIACCK